MNSALNSLTIGYGAIIDAQRALAGLRLTLFAQRPDAAIDGAGVKEALAAAWSEAPLKSAGVAVAKGTVLLAPAGEPLLAALLAAQPKPPFAVEVPAFTLASPEVAAAVQAHHRSGGSLWLQGRQAADLAPELRGCFRHIVFDAAEPLPARSGGAVASGVRQNAEFDKAIRQGAVAVIGWPIEPAAGLAPSTKKVAPETQVLLDLIRRVDNEEPVEKLEAALKLDPTLAFRLLRYMNSAAFGLSVEISSFRHALMILGYQKLKRWLALLLASASKNPAMKPVMAAAVRRGLLMEELVRGSGDAQMRGEMFICGVFSLLDVMLEQPFIELFKSVPVPERVQQALVQGEGSFAPYLELVRALERSDAFEAQEHAAALMLSAGEINRALLAALVAAAQLD